MGNKEVGTRIRIAREHRGMTQQDLGVAIGVTFQQIQHYEVGRQRIGPAQLEAIAAVLKIDVASFFPSMDGRSGIAPEIWALAPEMRALVEAFENLKAEPRAYEAALAAVSAFIRTYAGGDK